MNRQKITGSKLPLVSYYQLSQTLQGANTEDNFTTATKQPDKARSVSFL